MKRRTLFLLFIVVAVNSPAITDSLYNRANDLYQEGDYEKALNLYREVLDAGVESPDLYYNMGNAAYRSNSIGYSMLYYEKALKMEPTHEDARHNLEFVSRYRVDAFDPVPEFFLKTWIRVMVQSMSERTWSVLALALFVVLMISILVYLFSHRLVLKKSGFFTALFGLLFFIISLLAARASHRDIIKPESGIIISPSVVVRSSPSEAGTELFILHEGTRVQLNEEVSEWQNIRVIDGREGWIAASELGSI